MKSTLTAFVLFTFMLAGCSKETATTGQKSPPEPVERPAPSSPQRVIAAGASVTVRTTNSLSTATAKPGDAFSATLEEPLRSGDRVVVAKGSRVEGRIVESDKGGRVKGRAVIAVQLVQLHAAGRGLDISTNTIEREAKGTKLKDAEKIGLGSGVGAAIGALAGGGKGAAIGAAAGAGAGAGVVLATRGAAAVIPSESVMIFELKSPLAIP